MLVFWCSVLMFGNIVFSLNRSLAVSNMTCVSVIRLKYQKFKFFLFFHELILQIKNL